MTEPNDTAGDPSADPGETLPASTHPYKYQQVAIAKIIVPPGRRPPDTAKVEALAKSIEALGQLQPIGLTSDLRLLYGRSRMAAHELLGHETIQAIILALDDLHAELAEIDENIERKTLTALEEDQALARRKAIYLTLHPEAKPVTEKGGPGRGKKTNDNVSSVSFANDAATKTGQSARTIQRKVEIGEKIDAEAADILRGTKYENSQSILKRLADLPIKKQRERAKELNGGAPPRILQKRKAAKYRIGSFVRTGDGVYKLVDHDLNGQFQAVRHDGGPVTLVAQSAIVRSATKREWIESRSAQKSKQMSAEPLVDSDATARDTSESAALYDPQLGLVATDATEIFDAVTEGWEYDRRLEALGNSSARMR